MLMTQNSLSSFISYFCTWKSVLDRFFTALVLFMCMILVYLLGSSELTEAAILKEVIFAFQGITGSYIHYDAAKQSFAIDTKVCIELCSCPAGIFSIGHFPSC